ncbi:MAG TPA: hypothetical protein VLX68_03015 [Chitinivibrionales bacterium]|nr:hypothetical protein [Chitinivibrionales bacterium]
MAFAVAAVAWWYICAAWPQSPGTAIKINEIFPRAQTDCPEWLELANTSGVSINIKNWKYGHLDDSCLITATDFFVPANGFVVLTKDMTLFSAKYPATVSVIQPVRWRALDNYHDTLYVWDSSGVLCESAGWDSHWFDSWTDQSLARVSLTVSGLLPEAWVVASKASPGQPNSDAMWRASGAQLDIGPIPFTPNNDGKDDFLSIQLSLPAAATAVVSIYGFDGRKYLDLPTPPSRQFLWNGIAAGGRPAPAGPFFVVAEISENGNKHMIRKKGILWR